MEGNALQLSPGGLSAPPSNPKSSANRCWHPVMYVPDMGTDDDTRNVEKFVEKEQEVPHHRVIRNIRRFFGEVGDNRQLRDRIVEDMLLALPTVSKDQDA